MKRLLLGLLTSLGVSTAYAQVNFNLSSSPNNIEAGDISTLTFDIYSVDPLENIDFAVTLPAGMELIPDSENGDCGFVNPIPAGGTVVEFSARRLAKDTLCRPSVKVTSQTVGTHFITTSDLNSLGQIIPIANPASGNLTVSLSDPDINHRLEISKNNLVPGEVATLSAVIEKIGPTIVSSGGLKGRLSDNLYFASPVDISSNCNGLSATIDESRREFSISSFGTLFSECRINADVVAVSEGTASAYVESNYFSGVSSKVRSKNLLIENDSADILVLSESSGQATPGGSDLVSLRIKNLKRSTLEDINFLRDYGADISGANLSPAVSGNPCPGVQFNGGEVSANINNLLSNEECTIAFNLEIPAGAVAGKFRNITTTADALINSSRTALSVAAGSFNISEAVDASLSFSSSAISAGDDTTLSLEIRNSSTTSTASNIAASLTLPPELNVKTLPTNNSCGLGSLISQTTNNGEQQLLVRDGTLNAGSSCQLDFILSSPNSNFSRQLEIPSFLVVSSVSGEQYSREIPVTAVELVGGPKIFIEHLLSEGESPYLQASSTSKFQLYIDNGSPLLSIDPPSAKNDIQLELNQGSTSIGVISNLSSDTGCQGASIDNNGTRIQISDLDLASGQRCGIAFDIVNDANLAPGAYSLELENTQFTAVETGLITAIPSSSLNLQSSPIIASLAFSKDHIEANESVSLTLRLENTSSFEATNGILDVIRDFPGNFVASNATDICGIGSTLTVNVSTVFLRDFSIPANGHCEVTVDLTSNPGASPGHYAARSLIGGISLNSNATQFPASVGILQIVADNQFADASSSELSTAPADRDGDGVSDDEEFNSGFDLNSDGIADFTQSNVATLRGSSVGNILFEVSGGCNQVEQLALSNVDSSSFNLWGSAISFELPCNQADIRLVYDSLPDAAAGQLVEVQKFGHQAPNFSGSKSWYTLNSAVIDKNNNEIRYSLTDGGFGDDTPVDGRIVDPIAVVVRALGNPTGVPSTPLAILALLFVSLIGLGSRHFMRRQLQPDK